MRTFGKWLGRLLLLVALGVVAFLIVGPRIADKNMNPVDYRGPYPVSEAAKTLHHDMIVGDWHADTMLWNRDINKRNDRESGRRLDTDMKRHLLQAMISLMATTTLAHAAEPSRVYDQKENVIFAQHHGVALTMDIFVLRDRPTNGLGIIDVVSGGYVGVDVFFS